MGLIVEKTGSIETVGQLIDALKKFPADMDIECRLSGRLQVYRVKPQRGEAVDDRRGRICIEDDD